MDLATLLPLLAAALGGGGISALIIKLLERKDRLEEGEIGRLRADVKEARAEVAAAKTASEECEKRFEEQSVKMRHMLDRLRVVETSTPSYLARWVKGQDKRILWLNDRAYMTMFAPLGWSRADVLDKTFNELLGDDARAELQLLDEIDERALRRPGEVQSLMLQLHPDLPAMVVVKVAFADPVDGLLRYEGSSFVPNTGFQDAMGLVRQLRARQIASDKIFGEGEA